MVGKIKSTRTVGSKLAGNEAASLLAGVIPGGDFEPWDGVLYGSLVKNARKKAGFANVESFTAGIYRKTRVYISRDVYYKLEQGRQTPSIVQFMAINITLFDIPMPTNIALPCICPEWLGIVESGGEIPGQWREENTRALEEQKGRTFATPEEAATTEPGGDPRLFAPSAAKGEREAEGASPKD